MPEQLAVDDTNEKSPKRLDIRAHNQPTKMQQPHKIFSRIHQVESQTKTKGLETAKTQTGTRAQNNLAEKWPVKIQKTEPEMNKETRANKRTKEERYYTLLDDVTDSSARHPELLLYRQQIFKILRLSAKF